MVCPGPPFLSQPLDLMLSALLSMGPGPCKNENNKRPTLGRMPRSLDQAVIGGSLAPFPNPNPYLSQALGCIETE